jgi:hypothetical protein
MTAITGHFEIRKSQGNMVMKYLPALTLLSVLWFFAVARCYASSDVFVENKAELTTSSKAGTSVRVVIQKITIASDYPFKSGFNWGGGDTELPKTLVSSVQVWIGNEKIFVPLSAYSDLGNPRTASLKKTRKGFEIKIGGGDAAGAYSASLLIENSSIRRRKVVSGEFPDQVWEETIYSFIPRDAKM